MTESHDDKDNNQAQRIVDSLLESHPKNVDLNSFKALSLGQMEKFPEAIE